MENIKSYFTTNYQQSIDFLAALLVLFLPLSTALPNIVLIPLVLLFVLNFKKMNWTRITVFYLLASSLLVIMLLAVYKGSVIGDFSLFSRFLLLIGLLFIFAKIDNVKRVEHYYLAGIFTALVGSAIAVLLYSNQNPGYLLDSGSKVNDLLWLERPYFGIMLSLGTFICFKNAEKYQKNDYYILALLFIGFSIYISARLSIFLNVLLIFIFLLKNAQIQKGTKIGIAFAFVLLVSIAAGLSDNLVSRMKITNDWDKTAKSIKAYEPRFIIWPCAINTIQNDMNLFVGLGGYEQTENKLTACYAASIEKEDKKNYYLERKFNTHNQFLDFLLVGGIVPFLLLIYAFFHVWFSKKSSFELKIVFLLFFAFFLVENVLHRQLGCFLFGIFTALYFKGKDEN